MQEFTDFLAKQPSFSALSTDDLERLSSNIEVEYFAEGTVIIVVGSDPLNHFYIIRTGSVEVLDRGNVVDLLDSGDAFGHTSLLAGLPPQYSFRAAEDTLCYRLPDPREIVQNQSALNFNQFGTTVTRNRLTATAVMSDAQAMVTKFMREIVWVNATDSIREVAIAMSAAEQSCAIIRSPEGLGIISDRDFRSRIGVGEISIDSPVHSIMNSPLITIPDNISLATAFLRMVESGVHHLVVLNDSGHPVGVVRAMDLASVELRNPLMIRVAIESAKSLDELFAASKLLMPTLVELHDSGIPSLHVGALMSAIVTAILSRLIKLAPEKKTLVDHSWLILGSMARGEPLPISDVDTAIVWADLSDGADPSLEIQQSAQEFLLLMEKCGLQRCTNGANADNLLFSRSKSSWIKASSGWLTDPTLAGALLLSAMAADSQPITQMALGRTITETIRETSRTHAFLQQSLLFAVAKRPPIGFVREFVVHQTGENKGELNLKDGGLTPISSLARWLAIAQGDVRGGTIDRLNRAKAADILLNDEGEILINAFSNIHQMIFEQEILAIREGRAGSTWISPEQLDSLTRSHLRENFRAISTIQDRIQSEWEIRLR